VESVRKHANCRGIWGYAPRGFFWKFDALRSPTSSLAMLTWFSLYAPYEHVLTWDCSTFAVSYCFLDRLWSYAGHWSGYRWLDLWHQLTQAAALHPSVAAPPGGCVHGPWSGVANSRTYAKCCDMCMQTQPGCRMDDTLTTFEYDYTLTRPHLSLLESSDAGDCVTVSQMCMKTSTA